MTPKYYVLHIWGDVEPQLHGPFDCEADRDSVALSVRASDTDDCPGGVYPIEIDKHGDLQVDTYSGGFFDEVDEEDRPRADEARCPDCGSSASVEEIGKVCGACKRGIVEGVRSV